MTTLIKNDNPVTNHGQTNTNLAFVDEESQPVGTRGTTTRSILQKSRSTVNLDTLINHDLLQNLPIKHRELFRKRLSEVDVDQNGMLDSDEVMAAFFKFYSDLEASKSNENKAMARFRAALGAVLVLVTLLAVQFAGNTAVVKKNQPVAIQGADNLVTKEGNQVKVLGTAHEIKALEFAEEEDDRDRRRLQLHSICSSFSSTRRLQDEGATAATSQVSLGCFDDASVNAIAESAGGTIKVQTPTGFQTLAVQTWSVDDSSGVIYVNEDQEDAFVLHPSSVCQASSDGDGGSGSGRSLVTAQAYNLCMKGGMLNTFFDCLHNAHDGPTDTLSVDSNALVACFPDAMMQKMNNYLGTTNYQGLNIPVGILGSAFWECLNDFLRHTETFDLVEGICCVWSWDPRR